MKEFFLAIAISILLTCGIVLTDYPEKWFQHGMVCDGGIGGGCDRSTATGGIFKLMGTKQ